MRRTLLALLLPAACLSIQAETTGRITGKITNKAGAPIPNAKINLKRTDNNWSKDVQVDKNGKYFQFGLVPGEVVLTVTAEGYVEYQERVKINIGDDQLAKDVVLLTPAEALAKGGTGAAQAVIVDDQASALDSAGREAFNVAIPYYNEGKYREALPSVQKAYKSLSEAREKLKDETAKADLDPELSKIERVLGICLAQAGDKKEEGEPHLLRALTRNPKDERVIASLIQTSKAKNDAAAEAKYTAMLEAIQGPNTDMAYNKAVESFNAGKTKEAKAQLQKVLAADPKYAEAHFLLAMVEFGDNNLKNTKHHLQKYVELAPTGKNASMAKEMLKDPSLKNLK
jgi:tetratricopeptide (TPR) repeat protein